MRVIHDKDTTIIYKCHRQSGLYIVQCNQDLGRGSFSKSANRQRHKACSSPHSHLHPARIGYVHNLTSQKWQRCSFHKQTRDRHSTLLPREPRCQKHAMQIFPIWMCTSQTIVVLLTLSSACQLHRQRSVCSCGLLAMLD